MKAGTAVSTPTAEGANALISLTYTPGVRRFLKFGSAIGLLLVVGGVSGAMDQAGPPGSAGLQSNYLFRVTALLLGQQQDPQLPAAGRRSIATHPARRRRHHHQASVRPCNGASHAS